MGADARNRRGDAQAVRYLSRAVFVCGLVLGMAEGGTMEELGNLLAIVSRPASRLVRLCGRWCVAGSQGVRVSGKIHGANRLLGICVIQALLSTRYTAFG